MARAGINTVVSAYYAISKRKGKLIERGSDSGSPAVSLSPPIWGGNDAAARLSEHVVLRNFQMAAHRFAAKAARLLDVRTDPAHTQATG